MIHKNTSLPGPVGTLLPSSVVKTQKTGSESSGCSPEALEAGGGITICAAPTPPSFLSVHCRAFCGIPCMSEVFMMVVCS